MFPRHGQKVDTKIEVAERGGRHTLQRNVRTNGLSRKKQAGGQGEIERFKNKKLPKNRQPDIRVRRLVSWGLVFE